MAMAKKQKKKSQLHRNWLMNNASIKNNQNLEFIVDYTNIKNGHNLPDDCGEEKERLIYKE